MPRQREEILNGELGRLLINRHPRWDESIVYIDSTDTIRGHRNFKIDVLIDSPGSQPTAIETKFEDSNVGSTLKDQVDDRIGLTIDNSGNVIESGLSVVFPRGLNSSGVRTAKLKYAIHQLNERDIVSRWPEDVNEWMEGAIEDLANAIEVVSLSEKKIRKGEILLSEGVQDTSAKLNVDHMKMSFRDALGTVLHQEPGSQTERMAAAIVVNAFIFHYAIEGEDSIPNVAEGAKQTGFIKSLVLKAWEDVLKVNYWPIFSIARAVLDVLPTRIANSLLDQANEVAEQLLTVGTTTFHDLAARMFQKLITDRKLLATYYTLPESACLLAELAVAKLSTDWTKSGEIETLKIADFACGAGILLSATQRSIYRRLRRAGFDDRDWHGLFMEKVLLGTDIMPSAAHLTASMLSSAHPSIAYQNSLIRVLPYGIDEDLSKRRKLNSDEVYLGALDLRLGEFGQSVFTSRGMGTQIELGGKGIVGKSSLENDGGRSFPAEHSSFDLVIMNPPFTRPTGHEGKKIGIPVPSFAGFGTPQAEQRAMSKKLRALDRRFGNGNAGLASEFMDLAHDKVKPGGVIALVLPFSFASGKSWSKAREILSREYCEIEVVSIASTGTTARSFSADTGMAECLVVARRRTSRSPDSSVTAVRFSNLDRRPLTLIESHEIAAKIASHQSSITATFQDSGVAGVRDSELISVLIALSKGNIDLPRSLTLPKIPVTEMQDVARRGLYHMDINGSGERGAFDIQRNLEHGVPAYPALWNHDASIERFLIVQPDARAVVRPGRDKKAKKTWRKTASRLHYNVDFQINSQSLCACLTAEPCIGGTAWPNLIPLEEKFELPTLLWLNTTFGIMLYWWFGARPHMGRARLKITAIPTLPTLDVRQLDDTQYAAFEALFDKCKNYKFKPANEAYRDDARISLDNAVMRILNVPDQTRHDFDLVRMKWCSEPSVHGGKTTRPQA